MEALVSATAEAPADAAVAEVVPEQISIAERFRLAYAERDQKEALKAVKVPPYRGSAFKWFSIHPPCHRTNRESPSIRTDARFVFYTCMRANHPANYDVRV